jgi:hypothetical protein
MKIVRRDECRREPQRRYSLRANVDHIIDILQRPLHHKPAGSDDQHPMDIEHFRHYHYVGDACLVFHTQKHDAFCGPRTLANDDTSRDADVPAGADARKLRRRSDLVTKMAQVTERVHFGAVVEHGMVSDVDAGAAIVGIEARWTVRRVDTRYWSVVFLSFVVQAALNRSICWSSIQGLGNGFLFLVLVVASMLTEAIDRNFGRAALWCLLAAMFSWFGLMHSALIRWGAQPAYAAGWLAAAAILYSARWWPGDTPPAS